MISFPQSIIKLFESTREELHDAEVYTRNMAMNKSFDISQKSPIGNILVIESNMKQLRYEIEEFKDRIESEIDDMHNRERLREGKRKIERREMKKD